MPGFFKAKDSRPTMQCMRRLCVDSSLIFFFFFSVQRGVARYTQFSGILKSCTKHFKSVSWILGWDDRFLYVTFKHVYSVCFFCIDIILTILCFYLFFILFYVYGIISPSSKFISESVCNAHY